MSEGLSPRVDSFYYLLVSRTWPDAAKQAIKCFCNGAKGDEGEGGDAEVSEGCEEICLCSSPAQY